MWKSKNSHQRRRIVGRIAVVRKRPPKGDPFAPLHGFLYRDHASDVIGLIEALGLAAPVLLRHSMGGMTAAVVASQVGTAIRGVILADPTFLSPQRQREVHESDVTKQHRRLLSLNKDEVLAQARLRHPHASRLNIPM
jgi:N-formylmaleamate deformylase